jgi:hypothetical protein
MDDRPIRARGAAAAVLCALAACLPSGCGNGSIPNSPLSTQAANYVQLPGLRGSSHPLLQQAWRELEAEKHLPAQLSANRTNKLYAGFESAYPEQIRSALQREVNAIWPATALQLSPGALQQARKIVAAQSAARQRFTRAIDEISPQPQLRNLDRLQASEAWLDAASTGCRVEGLAAAETLAEGSPHEAIPHLARMLRVSEQLAREANLNVRLTAVSIRKDALQVLAAVANHPATTPATLQHLQQTLLAHTGDWPSDERVWIGERAHGLLVYELARDGQYLPQLPRELAQDLEPQGLARATHEVALGHVDDDEVFYLRAMQLQIAAAKLPYFQRATAIEQLQTELQTRQETGDFPLVAGSLLLPDVAMIHRRLAEDRCRCEAWLIVLAAAGEQPLGALPICSLTGKPYQLLSDRNQVALVDLPLSAGEEIRVRRPGVIQAQRRAAGFELQ